MFCIPSCSVKLSWTSLLLKLRLCGTSLVVNWQSDIIKRPIINILMFLLRQTFQSLVHVLLPFVISKTPYVIEKLVLMIEHDLRRLLWNSNMFLLQFHLITLLHFHNALHKTTTVYFTITHCTINQKKQE